VVQYKIEKNMVKVAVFDIKDPIKHIESYIDDILRAEFPNLLLDEAYAAKEHLRQVRRRLLRAAPPPHAAITTPRSLAPNYPVGP
jgi:regulator of protease activity HflC (stomatin/prohibitin superfamily)